MSISTDVVCLMMIGVSLQMPLVDATLRDIFSKFLDFAQFFRFKVLELVTNKVMK